MLSRAAGRPLEVVPVREPREPLPRQAAEPQRIDWSGSPLAFDDSAFDFRPPDTTATPGTTNTPPGTPNTPGLPVDELDLGTPNLVLVEFNAPADLVGGEVIEVSWTVRNDGDGRARGGWHDWVEFVPGLSSEGSDDCASGGYLTSKWAGEFAPLAPGESYTVRRTLQVPFDLASTEGALRLTIDRWDRLVESSETDNTSRLDAEVSGTRGPGGSDDDTIKEITDLVIDARAQSAITGAIDGLVRFGERLQGFDVFGVELPLVVAQDGVPVTLGSLFNFADDGGLFDAAVRDPIAGFFKNDPDPTYGELIAVLGNVPGVVGDVVAQEIASLGEIRVDLSLVLSSPTLSLPLSFRETIDAFSLSTLDATATALVTASADVALDLSFGYLTDPGLSPQEAGYIRIEQASATGRLSATGMNAELLLGFIDARMTNGSVSANATVTLDLLNPDGDATGRVTAEELASYEIGDLVALPVTADVANATLPVEATVNGSTYFGAGAQIRLSGNLLSGNALTVTTAGPFAEIEQFTQLDRFDIEDLLRQVANWLRRLEAPFDGDIAIPFLDGETYGGLAGFAQAWTDRLLGELGSTEAANANTANRFGAFLKGLPGIDATLVGPSYNATTNQLTYRLKFTSDLGGPITRPVGFDLNLSPLGSIETQAEATISTNVAIDFVIGVDISPLNLGDPNDPSDDESIFDRLFVANPSGGGPVFDATLSLTASDIAATAMIGSVAVQAATGSATLSGRVQTRLKNPDTGSTTSNVKVSDLLGGVGELSNRSGDTLTPLAITGSASASLQQITVAEDLLGPLAAGRVDISIPNLGNLSTLSVSYDASLAPLLDLATTGVNEAVAAVREAITFLRTRIAASVLDADLPIVGKSIAELANIDARLESLLNSLEAAAADTLQDLEGLLDDAIGVGRPFSGDASVRFETAAKKLEIDLSLDFSQTETASLLLDLGELAGLVPGGVPGLAGLGELVSAGTGGTFSVTATGELRLTVGIDLAPATRGQVYVRDTGYALGTAMLSASELSFEAALGPLGMFVRDGTAS
ncbi:MAG: CARDB domain-containing protein, partial [Phycisphaerales bacterium]|nr:CARDB domain-containing protein [Phycisphaerales bacterium]